MPKDWKNKIDMLKMRLTHDDKGLEKYYTNACNEFAEKENQST